MGKFLKILLSLIIIIVIILAALPFVIDPNDYRDEIVEAVEKQTGRKLTIDGELKLSVFPWVGIEIGKMALGNAQGFGDNPFAAIGSASVRIKLLPLFSSELQADTVTLDGLQLNLAKNSKGVTNWADLATAGGSEKTEKETSASSKGLAALAIGGVSITNATVNWDDQQTGQSYQVKNFNLNSGVILPGQPIDLSIKMDVDSSAPKMTATLGLDGEFEFALDFSTLSIKPLKFSVDGNGPDLPGGKLNAELSSNVDADLNNLNINLANLKLTSGDLALSGDLKLSDLANTAGVDGKISIAEMNLKKFLASLAIQLPEMSNPDALSKFSLNANLGGNNKAYTINNLAIKLDESSINGSAKQAGAHTEAMLNIDRINLDHYLPKKETTPTQSTSAKSPAPSAGSAPAQTGSATPATSSNSTTAKASASAAEAPLFPVETLRPLDISSKLDIGHLIVSGLTAEQVVAAVIAKNGKMDIQANIGRFYDGAFSSTTNLNVAGKTPTLAVKADLKNLQAGPLIKDLTQKDMIAGTGNFDMAITSSGNTVSALKKALNGNLSLALKDGAVKGFNLAKVIRDTRARFEGKAPSTSNEPEQTDFSEMTASAKITNGVLDNRDLTAKSPFIRVNGAGTVNIPAEMLDYTVEATIVESSKGQGGKELDDLKGLNIPVKLTGNWAAPKYEVDWGKVMLSSQKAKVDEKVEEKKKELEQKLQEKLGDKLFKGLF